MASAASTAPGQTLVYTLTDSKWGPRLGLDLRHQRRHGDLHVQRASITPGQTVGVITLRTTVLSSAPAVLTNSGVVRTLGATNPSNDTSTVKTPVTKVRPRWRRRRRLCPTRVVPPRGCSRGRPG